MRIKDVIHDSDNYSVGIILETDHIESVNNLYRARVAYKNNGKGKSKTAYPVIYKSPEAAKFNDELVEQLSTIDFKSLHPWIFESDYFDVTVQLVMNRSFNSRDLDNCLKIISDALFGHILNLNDSRVVSWRTWKSYLPESSKEFVMIKLDRSSFNVMFRSGLEDEEDNKD